MPSWECVIRVVLEDDNLNQGACQEHADRVPSLPCHRRDPTGQIAQWLLYTRVRKLRHPVILPAAVYVLDLASCDSQGCTYAVGAIEAISAMDKMIGMKPIAWMTDIPVAEGLDVGR